jgi:hypothetical protein
VRLDNINDNAFDGIIRCHARAWLSPNDCRAETGWPRSSDPTADSIEPPNTSASAAESEPASTPASPAEQQSDASKIVHIHAAE